MAPRETNTIGDLVLIHFQDKPAVYGRIEAIEPDVKKDWYQVTLLLLTLPAQTVTWILREAYINGESFTMGGQPMRLERVAGAVLGKEHGPAGSAETRDGNRGPGKVIPLKRDS